MSQTAFQNCTQLESVNLKRVTRILAATFMNCTALNEVNLESVEQIYKNAFQGCISINEIVMPQLRKIDEDTFKTCKITGNVEFLELKTIEDGAFMDSELEHINMPQLDRIGAYGFLNTTLRKLNLNVREIGKYAFKGSMLVEIDLPLLKLVETEVFSNCKLLVRAVIPYVQEIENLAFQNCS